MNTSGFYSKGFTLDEDGNEAETLDYAPNFVYTSDFTLERTLKGTYQYPVHGWSWFEDEEDAKAKLIESQSII